MEKNKRYLVVDKNSISYSLYQIDESPLNYKIIEIL